MERAIRITCGSIAWFWDARAFDSTKINLTSAKSYLFLLISDELGCNIISEIAAWASASEFNQ
jgi:hypothetical protein